MSLRTHPFQIYYGPADDPLNSFYIPTLSASVQYDRSAGFYSSSSLAVAAAGVARLIQNGGRMRLLAGAQLESADIEAIAEGYDLRTRVAERLLDHFTDPQDALMRRRLEVLAWMVAEGTLDIKVALPRDARGLPLPASLSRDYYHPKTGVFTDTEGNRIAFSGSVNESETAWLKNYETFSVYFSWDATRAYLAQVSYNFEHLWNDQEPDWIALDIPQAVRDRLLQYRPARQPTHDPLEAAPFRKVKDGAEALAFEPSQKEKLLFQFVRDAPYLPNASALAAATSAITPWPHQTRVANAVIERYPDRAMLSDEVGLGKTIEAGLVMRQLILSGRVKRCLILAPKSVLRQWQEELYEKFALNVPRYDNGSALDVSGRPVDGFVSSPWDDFDLLLAGSQLAKREDRRTEILAARPWDLIVVDEAHHARRKDFKERIYRPNRLLGLLNDLNEQNKAASLLLLTATPMQVHPLEVWDLLTVLGMGGRWGADEDNFLAFFAELRKDFNDIDWRLVFTLVQDYLTTGGQLDPVFKAHVSDEVGAVKWALLEDLIHHPDQSARIVAQLGSKLQSRVKELAHHHTPLNRFVYRNTRALLREYARRGILHENVPYRKPELKRVPMRADEFALYTRIEQYISRFYQQYENERRGLGFVMTVYRRRLTSSFYAVRKSLERRQQWLRGVNPADLPMGDDDIEQEELEQDISDDTAVHAGNRDRFRAELDYLDDFIQDLKALTAADSKLEWLKNELNTVFKQRPTVLVFTQYTDTMDYLRDQLVEVYGSQVACYSGRGGEVWNGIAWAPTTKEAVKNDFASGTVSIMLCTESASEGLNLQTCGVLINYDMPWNPMRVEQRIGRIDRIGQKYDVVWVSNYFYRDTIEDQIYQRLADRIDWFEVVVGDLQPILAEVGEATRRLAMLPADEREGQLEKEIADLRTRLQNKEVDSLNLDEYASAGNYESEAASPVTMSDLEDLLTHSHASGHLFKPNPEIPDTYLLHWNNEDIVVTFSKACFDKYVDTVAFLSYGSRLLSELLEAVPVPEETSGYEPILRYSSSDELAVLEWFTARDAINDGGVQPIGSLAQLKQTLETAATTNQSLTPEQKAAASVRFDATVTELKSHYAKVEQFRQTAHRQALRAKAQRLLIKAALVELAIGQQPGMFDGTRYPTAFDESAVLGLQRHKYPWTALVRLAYEQGMAPSRDDPYYRQIAGNTREQLMGRFTQLREEARKMVLAMTTE